MKKLVRTALAALSVLSFVSLMTTSASADCTKEKDANGAYYFACAGRVEKLFFNGSTLFIATPGTAYSSAKSSDTTFTCAYLNFPATTPGFATYSSMLTANYLSGKNVVFRTKGATGADMCSLLYIVLQ